MAKLRRVTGMHDVLPDPDAEPHLRSASWRWLEAIFADIAQRFGFQYIETPEVEPEELFVRTVGETSDIVSKEMYTWTQSERRLALRPEGSASVARALIDSTLLAKPPVRVWYRSAMFRRDRPQFGRYRRHVQLGIETIGAAGPEADVEVIQILDTYFRAAGLQGYRIHVNSIGDDVCRPAYIEEIRGLLRPLSGQVCSDCRRRIESNPLRVFDCKEPADRALYASLPRIVDRLCEPCESHFASVKEGLRRAGVSHRVDPEIVRGLDYYTRTAFEVVLDEPVGQMGTVTGGGRYDNLYQTLGPRSVPGVGFGAGVERLLLALDHQGAEVKTFQLDAYVVTNDSELEPRLLEVAQRLRDQEVRTAVAYDARRLAKQLQLAADSGALLCVMVLADEWERDAVAVKVLETGILEEVPLSKLGERAEELSRAF